MERNPIKLSDLTKQIEGVIKNSFGSTGYWILAEISGHKFYPNKDRHYFEFIEKSEEINEPVAKVTGVAWSSGAQQIKTFEASWLILILEICRPSYRFIVLSHHRKIST